MKKNLIFLFLLLTICSLANAKTHAVKNGDTLWDLSYKYYSDPTLWETIAEVNGISDPQKMPSGIVIVIPDKNIMKQIQKESDKTKKQELIKQAGGKPVDNSQNNNNGNIFGNINYSEPSENDTRLENILLKEIDEKNMIVIPQNKAVESNY